MWLVWRLLDSDVQWGDEGLGQENNLLTVTLQVSTVCDVICYCLFSFQWLLMGCVSMSWFCVKDMKARSDPSVSLDGTVRDRDFQTVEWWAPFQSTTDGGLLCLLNATAIWKPGGNLDSYVLPGIDIFKLPSTFYFSPISSLVLKADTRRCPFKPVSEFVLCLSISG